eukprot:gene18975-24786_t
MTSRVDPSYLVNLLPKTENIRNFCILAHVDHGKTTLSDSLVCSNGVISPKLAGKARYLDSTEEEQRRGITMHSSAISLLFKLEDKANNTNEDYLINLVDSPGHIDFSSDVSTATRLCDGALIVVDVLEDPIWQLYEAAIIEHDPEKAAKMAHRGLGVDLPQREINNRDPRLTIQAIFRKWLPLSDALVGDLSAVDLTMISNKNPNEKYDNTKEIFMALGRVFSGVIDRNSCLYVLGNRHDPLLDKIDITSDESSIPESLQSTVKILPPGSFGLYICLGPSVYPIDKAYAGNIIGIIGLDEFVFKTGTVSSTWMTEPMKSITFQAKPMVRVAVEPISHNDLNKLEIGMHELYQYDPVVEIGVDDSGQHIMTCLGELHLELCIKTLQEKFAK